MYSVCLASEAGTVDRTDPEENLQVQAPPQLAHQAPSHGLGVPRAHRDSAAAARAVYHQLLLFPLFPFWKDVCFRNPCASVYFFDVPVSLSAACSAFFMSKPPLSASGLRVGRLEMRRDNEIEGGR